MYKKTVRKYHNNAILSQYRQIRGSLADLKKESSHLQEVWEEQRQRLDQMLQLQLFLRDAKIVVRRIIKHSPER